MSVYVLATLSEGLAPCARKVKTAFVLLTDAAVANNAAGKSVPPATCFRAVKVQSSKKQQHGSIVHQVVNCLSSTGASIHCWQYP